MAGDAFNDQKYHLTAIQRRVMQAGGTMEVQARPRYRLCVNLPKEETI